MRAIVELTQTSSYTGNGNGVCLEVKRTKRIKSTNSIGRELGLRYEGQEACGMKVKRPAA